jgi:uncharacterized protein
MRDAGNLGNEGLDVDAMLASLDRVEAPVNLFGGEPLLTPIHILERLFRHSYAKHGHSNIQTNGTILTKKHLELFKALNVTIGISLDGPPPLNRARCDDHQTMKILTNIETLFAANIIPSFIVTIHKLNAVGMARQVLLGWLGELNRKGAKWFRLHLMENDGAENIRMSQEEENEAILDLMKNSPVRFDLFKDTYELLKGNEKEASCIWHSCDPYTTAAVHGIDPDGSLSNCGRTVKDGVAYRKGDAPGHERQLALYHTPQTYGGCRGCRFFLACKGSCPGEGIGGDWRSRTDHCGTLKTIFSEQETIIKAEGTVPLSLSPNRKRLEEELLAGLMSPRSGGNRPHGDSPHGDAPHGDITRLGVLPIGKAGLYAPGVDARHLDVLDREGDVGAAPREDNQSLE